MNFLLNEILSIFEFNIFYIFKKKKGKINKKKN